MGTAHTYKCNKCNYEVLSSGKLDFGMIAVVDAYICTSCKAVVDICIGENGRIYTKEDIAIKHIKSNYDLDFYCCPECGSDKNLVKWNIRTRPCPKCDGRLNKDRNAAFCLWD